MVRVKKKLINNPELWFKLRLALGLGMTLAQLDQTMGYSELQLWKAYYELEPFGPSRDNYNTAVIGALIGNIWRAMNKNAGKPYRYDDFMFIDDEIRQRNKDAEFLNFMESRCG